MRVQTIYMFMNLNKEKKKNYNKAKENYCYSIDNHQPHNRSQLEMIRIFLSLSFAKFSFACRKYWISVVIGFAVYSPLKKPQNVKDNCKKNFFGLKSGKYENSYYHM